MSKDTLKYTYGFNNYHQSEAVADALPKNQNSPQKSEFGLYTEQLSGSAFTTTREHTKLSWCYRIQPSVVHSPFEYYQHLTWQSPPFDEIMQSPNQLRWSPENTTPTTLKLNLIDSIKTICGFGSPKSMQGAAASTFFANKAMSDDRCYFSNNDADMLLIIQSGSAVVTTEFGKLIISQDSNNSDIIVIPRGIRFKMDPITDSIRGYICENFGYAFELPELGPIGANGLANPRHFEYPTAAYEENIHDCKWICKYQGKLWLSALKHSPCNVVAWHGNYAPYKYNLNLFNTINTVSFDHPDPSIFTVLTSPSGKQGVANIDFVIFPPRWMVADNTFRPPYFHRNIMSEFMGLIKGQYDAKQIGFLPGGCSLHNRMSAHGPDSDTVMAAETANLQPEKYQNTLAFMLESNIAWDVTDYALKSNTLQKDYYQCWQDLPARFSK